MRDHTTPRRTFIPCPRCELFLKFGFVVCIPAHRPSLPPPESDPTGLRSSIERRGLDINREFLDASGQAQEALAVVDAQLEGLLSGCRRIANVLDRSRERTGILLNETARVGELLKEKLKARRG